MNSHFAITCIGKDRPGIVSRVTRVLLDTGANIEDSSMTILRGELAMILIVSAPGVGGAGDFREKFAPVMEDFGLHITVESLSEEELAAPAVTGGEPYIISVIGADKPGIVHRLTSVLAERDINITDMNTKVISSDGTPVYIMVLEVSIPEGADVAALEEEFGRLGGEMSIDITMREVEVLEL